MPRVNSSTVAPASAHARELHGCGCGCERWKSSGDLATKLSVRRGRHCTRFRRIFTRAARSSRLCLERLRQGPLRERIETRFVPTAANRTTRVWRRRPQVRPLGGRRLWPASSSRHSQAPKSAALLLRRTTGAAATRRPAPRHTRRPCGRGPGDSSPDGATAGPARPGCGRPGLPADRSGASGPHNLRHTTPHTLTATHCATDSDREPAQLSCLGSAWQGDPLCGARTWLRRFPAGRLK